MNMFRFSSLEPTVWCAALCAMILLGGCAQDTITGPAPEDAETEVTVTQASHNANPAHSDDGGSLAEPDGGHNTTNED